MDGLVGSSNYTGPNSTVRSHGPGMGPDRPTTDSCLCVGGGNERTEKETRSLPKPQGRVRGRKETGDDKSHK